MATPKASTSSADTQITKRLHVSGLTTNITKDDLSKRLSTFGTVTALDKFGEKDAVGQAKKFGYVTIETTQGKLARCMNLLSGTTWKGAKLRIGEAKPGWRERLQKERDTDPEPRKKKPKRYGGLMAEDMSLVTPANASSRAGWKVTPLGRVLHPVKMRPSHPLPPTKDALEMQRKEEEAAKKGKTAGKKRKRAKEPDMRARRQTIDVTKWGSTHLKGAFLDAVVADGELSKKLRDQLVVEEDVGMESGEDEMDEDDEQGATAEEEDDGQVADEEADSLQEEPPAQTKPPSGVAPPQLPSSPSSPQRAVPSYPPAHLHAPSTLGDDDDDDITAEKSRSLNLLASLFGTIDDGDDDWDGRESLDSDIDEEAVKKSRQDRSASGGGVDREDEFEVVPRDTGKNDKNRKTMPQNQPEAEEQEEEEIDEQDAEDADMADAAPPKQQPESAPTTQVSAAAPAPAPPKQATNLKDLFAPRDDEAGFSLIGHLDLDLELDDEIPFAIDEPTPADGPATSFEPSFEPSLAQASAQHTARKNTSGHPTFFLDPKKPLFFPHPPPASGQPITKARPKDVLEHFVELGWGWRQPLPSSTDPTAEKEKERLFYRTATEEEIRKRWEDKKVDLTREWKRRHKEASKFSRRRGGDGEMV